MLRCPVQVHSVAWNCTGRKLASGSVDRTARIWDIHHVRAPPARVRAHAP
jgi:THO complex subunit 3